MHDLSQDLPANAGEIERSRARALVCRPMRVASPRLLVAALALGAVCAGCGKSAPPPSGAGGGGSAETAAGSRAHGAASVATRNTTRLGGADPASDAAAVARASYPGLTAATRPQTVVLADERDWRAALVGAALASAPLGAPLLYGDAGALPEASAQALRALHPTGASTLGGAQAISLGGPAAVGGYRTRVVSATGPYTLAVAVEQLLSVTQGSAPRQVIVVAADGPPALAMPAAGLSAESGAPILFVTAAGVPAATSAVLRGLHRPTVYLVGAAAVGSRALAGLARLGTVKRVAAAGEGTDPVDNAIAVARYTDGGFGWGVKEPGHGLVFASAARPLDAPAAALLSASGQYGPLLLLESASAVPAALARYLGDIQPAYSDAPQFQPVHGSYNHGWLIGDERAISAAAQAEIDAMLEIAHRSGSEEEASATPPE
jgi:hypothetical protein